MADLRSQTLTDFSLLLAGGAQRASALLAVAAGMFRPHVALTSRDLISLIERRDKKAAPKQSR